MDDEVFINILTAIQEKKMVHFETYSSRSKNPFRQTILPLRVAINVKHGRRYLLAYNKRKHNFFSFRLDYIKNVHILEENPDFDKRLTELETRFSSSWGIFLGRKNHLEQLEMVISINESTEAYVLTRLKREGKHGTIEKVADNTFVYRIEVTDTQEMVPWLRTFIGRIISIKGSNQQVIKQFTDDIMHMAAMYEE
ncbi:WYL domain-containing protein [Sporomusa acidovorans]|uniref:WYL domain-containing protein n=1 Tax=Sporomusa acidovorans TaxID=112900 RepID=UPI0015A11F49|nr:WYL domain-containing protein [Sporomusa acidovorans]